MDVEKAYEQAQHWLLAHQKQEDAKENMKAIPIVWQAPESGKIKCNIGFSWSKQKKLAGVAWVVRNATGQVILHSRRAFSQVMSCFDAKIKSWERALESMRSRRIDNVTFTAQVHNLWKSNLQIYDMTIYLVIM